MTPNCPALMLPEHRLAQHCASTDWDLADYHAYFAIENEFDEGDEIRADIRRLRSAAGLDADPRRDDDELDELPF